MTPYWVSDVWDGVRAVSPHGWAARLAVLVSSLVFLLSVGWAGGAVNGVFAIPLFVATIAAIARPDGQSGLVLLVLLGVVWLVSAPLTFVGCLAPALSVLVCHVCLAYAAALPPRSRAPLALALGWVAPTAWVAGAVVVVWFAVQAFTLADAKGVVVVTVVALLVITAAGAALVTASRSADATAPSAMQ